jgi:hypothetical protein
MTILPVSRQARLMIRGWDREYLTSPGERTPRVVTTGVTGQRVVTAARLYGPGDLRVVTGSERGAGAGEGTGAGVGVGRAFSRWRLFRAGCEEPRGRSRFSLEGRSRRGLRRACLRGAGFSPRGGLFRVSSTGVVVVVGARPTSDGGAGGSGEPSSAGRLTAIPVAAAATAAIFATFPHLIRAARMRRKRAGPSGFAPACVAPLQLAPL